MDTIFQCPGTLQDVRLTRHRGAIIKVESQEELPDALISRLASLTGKEGWFTFNVEQIKAEDLVDLPPAPKIEGKKSKAKLQRDLIWRIGREEGINEDDTEAFYEREMDKIYAMLEYRLDPPNIV
jgi:hypothetical protein